MLSLIDLLLNELGSLDVNCEYLIAKSGEKIEKISRILIAQIQTKGFN